jgi:hypothetical protein
MADLRKRRLRLIVGTLLVFVAISISGALIGKTLGWSPFATTAVTTVIAVPLAVAMMDRIKKLK